jgi:hypothetical protein
MHGEQHDYIASKRELGRRRSMDSAEDEEGG